MLVGSSLLCRWPLPFWTAFPHSDHLTGQDRAEAPLCARCCLDARAAAASAQGKTSGLGSLLSAAEDVTDSGKAQAGSGRRVRRETGGRDERRGQGVLGAAAGVGAGPGEPRGLHTPRPVWASVSSSVKQRRTHRLPEEPHGLWMHLHGWLPWAQTSPLG